MPKSYQEIFNNYTKAQRKFISVEKVHQSRNNSASLDFLNKAKAIFDPIRDEAIIFAVNNPSQEEGLALLQFMNGKGVDPTLPLSDGRLLLELIVAKQAEPTPEGQEPAIWAQQLERIRVYAEQLPKLKETLARLEESTTAMTNSMGKLTMWADLQKQQQALDAAHNAAVVKAGQEYLEAKQTVFSSCSK